MGLHFSIVTVSCVSGGLAGSTVDFVLFPLDTLKTRAQSAHTSSSLRWYAGLASAMAGSFPAAAVFFGSYESCKAILSPYATSSSTLPLVHVTSASLANVAACGVRVPFEIVKQRMQSGISSGTTLSCMKELWKAGGARAFYTGYSTTVLREIPFDALQFAMWEYLKRMYSQQNDGRPLHPAESAGAGAIAGAIAAALTNPLDVVKTQYDDMR